ncbi:MAG: hypothetical protein KA807_10095 [Prolixibacteraceae bacterium]|nr:hypothetical protein [Prolixibacteraceae bacterium]
MKRIYLVLISAMIFSGCDDSFDINKNEMELASTEYRGCKGLKSTGLTDSTDLVIITSLTDNNYMITHYDASYNCCLPEGIGIDVSLSNDTLYFSEYEKVQGNCRCMCRYDVEAGMRNLKKGEYVLCMIKDYNILGTTTVLFKEGMKEEFYVSELNE